MRLVLVVFLFAGTGCSPDAAPPARHDGGRDASTPDGGPLPDFGMRDAGPDATPCDALALCGTECVDTENDPSHCGACDGECTAPANGRATCASGTCGFRCDAGYADVGGACVEAPRLLWPPSLSRVTSAQPVLRWEIPAGLGAATVELCRDRDCGTTIATIPTLTEPTVTPPAELPVGNVFWRITADGRASATWMFEVPADPIDGDGAWGIYPDFDGDGLGDVAVGAPRVEESEGRAYVHLGSPEGTPAGVSVIVRSPDGAGGDFALGMTAAGDLNGDGFGDLAVGAPRAGTGGRVHVFLGGPGGPSASPDASLDAPDGEGSLFGSTLAGLGDVDGDGFGDLVVGAIGEGVTPGRAYVYAGTADGVGSTPARALIGAGRFASSVAGAGDVNGDGFADLLVGAYQAAGGAGQAHLFLGSASGIGVMPDHTWDGTDGAGAQLGFATAGLGDVNNDGFADFAVSAPAAVSSRGRVYVFHGETDPPAMPATFVEGLNTGGGFFGHSVAGAGDVNGDGFSDLLVGAFGVDDRRGRASVISGGPGGVVPIGRLNIEGPFGGSGDFGWSVSGAGDVDGGGRHDIVVGAPGVDGGEGRAYVYRGSGALVEGMPFVQLIGASGGAFGRSLAHANR